MANIKITTSIFASLHSAFYKLDQYTTEYGTIIFDPDSKGGEIRNCFLYHIGTPGFGHIDVFIDKDTSILKSIWLVSLPKTLVALKKDLRFSFEQENEIPFFDLNLWKEKDYNGVSTMTKIDSDNTFIEVYHNGKNTVNILFGKPHSIIQLNNEIQLQVSKNRELAGIVIYNSTQVPKLLKKLGGH